MRTSIACMLIALLQGCAGQGSQVQDRFRGEYHCPSGTVHWLAGNTYRAKGCGYVVVYTCAAKSNDPFRDTPCVRESGPDPDARATSNATQQAWANTARGRVDRHYDEGQKAQIVEGDFALAPGVSLQLLGAPKLQLGDIAVHVVMPKSPARAPCTDIVLLVNGVPTPPATVTPVDERYRVRLIAHFTFEQFKPLAQRFPQFGVRCGNELRMSDGDVEQLQKFLAIYSDMATEAQSAHEAGPPAAEPGQGTPISL